MSDGQMLATVESMCHHFFVLRVFLKISVEIFQLILDDKKVNKVLFEIYVAISITNKIKFSCNNADMTKQSFRRNQQLSSLTIKGKHHYSIRTYIFFRDLLETSHASR